MVLKFGRKKFVMAVVISVALLLIVAVVAYASSRPTDNSDDFDTSKSTKKEAPAVSEKESASNTTKPAESEEPASESAIDPSTVTTIDIEPLLLTVSILKGTGGFDYEVLRTAGGTKYVQFSSEKLIGTKCTDDNGAFASIIEEPTSDESSTLAKTTAVDGTEYGLSLAEPTCTNDAGLLKQYQDAFSEPFNLLKKM